MVDEAEETIVGDGVEEPANVAEETPAPVESEQVEEPIAEPEPGREAPMPEPTPAPEPEPAPQPIVKEPIEPVRVEVEVELTDEQRVIRDWNSGAFSYLQLSEKYRYSIDQIREIVGDHDLDGARAKKDPQLP